MRERVTVMGQLLEQERGVVRQLSAQMPGRSPQLPRLAALPSAAATHAPHSARLSGNGNSHSYLYGGTTLSPLPGSRPSAAATPSTPQPSLSASHPPIATQAAMLDAWLSPKPALAASTSKASLSGSASGTVHPTLPPGLSSASIVELRDTMQSLVFELDVDRMWFRVAEAARSLARCERVSLYLVDEVRCIKDPIAV